MDTLDTRITKDRYIIDLKKTGFKNILVLGHYNYKAAKKGLETHIHQGIIEICFLEKGTQYYMVNNKEYLLKGGDVLITYPDEPHGTSSFPEEKGSLYWMLIKIPGDKGKILNLSHTESKILINRLLNLKTRQFRGLADIKSILPNIFKAYNNPDEPLRKVEISNSILSFLLKVIHSGEQDYRMEVSGDIKLICNYIKNNLQEDFNLEQLANMINLSTSRFKHRFKDETGIPPWEFILREKIERAKYLIVNTSLLYKDVAYDLGFSSSSYFATVFKRFTRMSPTELKLKNKNATQ